MTIINLYQNVTPFIECLRVGVLKYADINNSLQSD